MKKFCKTQENKLASNLKGFKHVMKAPFLRENKRQWCFTCFSYMTSPLRH